MIKTKKPEPAHEEIAKLAYAIWEDKLKNNGELSAIEDWLEAENVLRTKDGGVDLSTARSEN
jgi:hypothetical protein